MPLGTIFLLLATTSLVHAVQTFHQFLPYTIGRTYLRIKTINYQNMKTSFLQHKSISILKWNRKKSTNLASWNMDWFLRTDTWRSMTFEVCQGFFFFLVTYIIRCVELADRKLIILILSCEMDWFYAQREGD